MRRSWFVAAALAVGLGLGVIRDAAAATPVPTATPAAATGTPASTTTATPATATPTDQPMMVVGSAWVDARPSADDVHAFIGGIECASAPQFYGAGSTFTLQIPAASVKPGCGASGATVTFKIGTRLATQTLAWQAGAVTAETLVAGPPFTRYLVTYTYAGPPVDADVVPLINGVVCGAQVTPPLGAGQSHDVVVVVDPDELHAGCGKPGAAISFRLMRVADRSLLPASASSFSGIWGPGQTLLAQLRFVAPAMALPGTGALPGQRGAGREPLILVLALSAGAGIGLVLAGLRARLARR